MAVNDFGGDGDVEECEPSAKHTDGLHAPCQSR
jgi:hypothetical protein